MTNYIDPLDALKYAAAILRARTDWALDSIGGSTCEGADGHETECDAITDIVLEILQLASAYGDRRVYSDGRMVEQYAEIQPGFVTHHVWHPDPAAEERRSWRSTLPSNPGIPSPGIYEVTLEPAEQSVHVRVVRTA